MDWSFMERFAPLYVQAAGLTLRIGSLGIALSLGVGLLCCLARYYRVPGLRQISRAYIELARNTSLLVQLFFLQRGKKARRMPNPRHRHYMFKLSNVTTRTGT